MLAFADKGFRSVSRSILFSGCLFVFFNSVLFAQPPAPVEAQATSILLAQAREMLEAGQSDALLPYLKEILVRLEGNTTEEAHATRVFCMYQTGICQMQAGKYPEAIAAFNVFIKAYPDDSSASTAALLTAECYALQQDWPAVERTAQPLLNDKRFDAKRHLNVRQILAEALYRQQKWKEAAVPLLEVFKLADKEEIRSGAALMLSVCYARSSDFENLARLLPFCDESVRQDAALNMALIEAGDVKTSAGDYQGALKLYRMIFMKEELIAHYEQQLEEIKKFMAEPFVQRPGVTRSSYEETRRLKQRQADRMNEQLRTLRTGAGYDLDIALRMARCYAGLQRNWVAYTLYSRIFIQFPDHALAEEGRFQAFLLLLNMPQEQERALREGRVYLERHPSGKYTDEVSLNLAQHLLSAGKADEAKAEGLKALQLSPAHRYIDQVRYLIAFVDFQKQDYEAARAGFREILSRWPSSIYAEASEYWQSMCSLFMAQYDEAIAGFDAYLKNSAYPKKTFAEDVAYRRGVALYGKGSFPESEKAFRRFIETYPDSALRSEAFCMLGDLRGAEGELETSLDFYRKGLNAAVNIEQVNYAVFQTARVYELQKNYQAVIDLMERYLKDRGEEVNFAGAGFWMGKAYKAMNQYGKAIATYVNTAVQYGDVPQSDNVDLILRELVKEYKSEQGQADKPGFMEMLTDALRQAESRRQETLVLRLQTLLAYLTEGAERERYVSAVLRENRIEKSGAFTLMLFAEEAFARRKYALVHKVSDHFTAQFETSEMLPDVMNIKLAVLVQESRYPEAVLLAEEITGRFGYQKQIGLTRKLKADALRLSKQYDEAVKTYNELFAVREWRGPLTPESIYWIGYCLESQGKTGEAFAYFQRVYVMYEGYTEWSAKAYEGSLRCLEKLGRTEDRIKTLREMTAKADIAATPEGLRARAELDKLAPAGGGK